MTLVEMQSPDGCDRKRGRYGDGYRDCDSDGYYYGRNRCRRYY